MMYNKPLLNILTSHPLALWNTKAVGVAPLFYWLQSLIPFERFHFYDISWTLALRALQSLWAELRASSILPKRHQRWTLPLWQWRRKTPHWLWPRKALSDTPKPSLTSLHFFPCLMIWHRRRISKDCDSSKIFFNVRVPARNILWHTTVSWTVDVLPSSASSDKDRIKGNRELSLVVAFWRFANEPWYRHSNNAKV